MSLDPAKLQKPLRKLRKMLKKLPPKPSPELVHDLRTRTRRIEAEFQALMLDSRPNEQRLLNELKPIRRKAGKVRDMDVLTGFASKLRADGDEQCLVELLEHLGFERYGQARKLHRIVRRDGRALASRLKRSSRYIGKVLDGAKQPQRENEWPVDAMSLALQLSGELAKWAPLDKSNLHPFRLKVKELRYILQLSDHPDAEFVESLGEVKDAIGEWHDWEELGGIAEKVLDHGAGCSVMKLIRSTARKKFDHALAIANRMRHQYLEQRGPERRTRSKRPQTVLPKEPVVVAASSLAA
jgi:CHAD domain-containing protein